LHDLILPFGGPSKSSFRYETDNRQMTLSPWLRLPFSTDFGNASPREHQQGPEFAGRSSVTKSTYLKARLAEGDQSAILDSAACFAMSLHIGKGNPSPRRERSQKSQISHISKRTNSLCADSPVWVEAV
jgi:hypothetical protein